MNHNNAINKLLKKLFEIQEFAFEKENNKLVLIKPFEKCDVKITICPDKYNEKREAVIQVFNKEKEELFSIHQMPKGYSPSYIVKVKNNIVSYQIAEKMFNVANMELLMLDVEKQLDTNIQNKLNEYRKEEEKRLQSVLDSFNVSMYSLPPGYALNSKATGWDHMSDLFKYIMKDAPKNLFDRDEKNQLYYIAKLDNGEAKIQLHSEYLYDTKTPSITFTNKEGKEIFTLNKQYDQFNQFFSFNMYIQSKRVEKYESHLLLTSIPTIKLYNQIVDSIKNTRSFSII